MIATGLALVPTDLDAPVARQLVAELIRDLDARYGGDSTGTPPDPAQFAPPRGLFLVGYVDGEPVACGGVRGIADGRAEIKRMYVRPSARRRGVSRMLLDALEEAARASGYAEVWLETGLGQPEAIALYEACGYHGIIPYGDYKDYPDSRCFGKRL